MALIIKDEILSIHKGAMFYAQDAVVAQQVDREIEALYKFENAFNLEWEVLRRIKTGDPHIDTLGIILRSTATLAIDCKKYDTALMLLNEFLPFDFPEMLRNELEELRNDLQLVQEQKEKVTITNEVFIIEENASMRTLLKEIFKNRYDLILFDTVQQAADYMKMKGFPKLIILGIDSIGSESPQSNGLVKLLHDNYLTNKTRVVLLMEGKSDYDPYATAYKDIIEMINSKPFNPVAVIEGIESTWPDLSSKEESKRFVVKDLSSEHVSEGKPSTVKRLFDIVVSSILLVLLAPVFLLIALAIKLESRGPVFYVAPRAGRGYKIFKFIKFRTLILDADKKIEQLASLNQYPGSQKKPIFFMISNDSRITRVGAFLRNTSLDELPQLVNVLLGDMSLVGNRPLPLYESATLTTNRTARRFLAPVGITGLWQIKKRGTSAISVEERITLDIDYAEKNNFVYDLWILANTPAAMIQKENV